jgi:ergothioneine biosynthesis protein EgtB
MNDSQQPDATNTGLVPRQQALLKEYKRVRAFSEQIAAPLSPEDCVLQSMPDVSPTRWHLAHTTWFFETFVLKRRAGYQCFSDQFEYLFNSYYNTVGAQFPRSRRGLLSRPTVAEVVEYREYVDRHLAGTLAGDVDESLFSVVELGLNHEQQHQELMLTDIKHVLSCNPLFPVYQDNRLLCLEVPEAERDLVKFDAGTYEVGFDGSGFSFDNESPRHRVFLDDFSIQSRLVTCGDYLEFIEDGGYRRPELWLSLGWHQVNEQGWQAPEYWHLIDGRWSHFTLGGLFEVSPSLPVCHVSYFEADAYARWAGTRLPTEAEWEVASSDADEDGNFAERLLDEHHAVHPTNRVLGKSTTAQMMGDVWEWTSSPYVAYPGYQPAVGALGEYNGKFMCNQYVLRGGSCATPIGHVRNTYRNFFPPEARWQFTGIRLGS